MEAQVVSSAKIVEWFTILHHTSSSPELRKQADNQLLKLEKNCGMLLSTLLGIFEEYTNNLIRCQSLIYFSNVIKRNWSLRRQHKDHSQFEAIKRSIRSKILIYLYRKEKPYMHILFDVLKYICVTDYPHSFPEFSAYVQQSLVQAQLDDMTVLIFKHLKEIFVQLAERKGTVSHKHFEECLAALLESLCSTSQNFRALVEQEVQKKTLNCVVIKLSKYCDQIILAILRMASFGILQYPAIPQIMRFLLDKLQYLLLMHSSAPKNILVLLEKNTKSLLFDLGNLQCNKPFILSWVLTDYHTVLTYVLYNHTNFAKSTCLRNTLLGMRKFIKEFAYYSDDTAFTLSLKNRQVSSNFHQLREQCKAIYQSVITEVAIQKLMDHLVVGIMGSKAKGEHDGYCWDSQTMEKHNEKEMSVDCSVISLIEALLSRFTSFIHSLVFKLVMNCLTNNWSNIGPKIQKNLLAIVALLPASTKKQQLQTLQDIPILQILNHAYITAELRQGFPALVMGWLAAFSNQQLQELTDVLLNFISAETDMQLLLNSCQCLNKIVQHRYAAIDLCLVVQKVLPIAVNVFGRTDDPSILWPLVNLLSSTIVKVQVNTDLIVQEIDPSKLSLLICNTSELLVQALCDMFHGFLCVIPRNKPAPAIFQLVASFLNNHLSTFTSTMHDKVFHLWYIALREYSANQNSDQQYIALFHCHFRKNLYRKSVTMVYILEEYLLAGLVGAGLNELVTIIEDCYLEAEQMEKEQCEKLKIAALSFQITLITKHTLAEANSLRMLKFILQDFMNFDLTSVSVTLHNSLLSIINRYLILHREAFFQCLPSCGLALEMFFNGYFQNMEYLTSRASMKINAIALITLLNFLNADLILSRIELILELVIPQLQHYLSTVQTNGDQEFPGKVQNSPSLRFASNILSQRKDAIRKQGCFDEVTLLQYYRKQMQSFLVRLNVPIQNIAGRLKSRQLAEKLIQFC